MPRAALVPFLALLLLPVTTRAAEPDPNLGRCLPDREAAEGDRAA